ncbi:MAG TPA: hypothetical protein VFY64_01335 [Nitrososphaeraceae archaeon]|nr:hypothetical protein [Nitrososphaeraceae archaeon]
MASVDVPTNYPQKKIYAEITHEYNQPSISQNNRVVVLVVYYYYIFLIKFEIALRT